MKNLKEWSAECRSEWRAAVVNAGWGEGEASAAFRKALGLLPAVEWRPGGLVCIKPNLTTGKSAEGSGITTPRDAVDAVIGEINRATGEQCDIAIVESDSDGRIADTFRSLGYDELTKQHRNVRLVDLGKEPSCKVILPDWCGVRMVQLPEILLDADHFVNVANLKRHVQERLTCCWKNLYGLPADHLTRQRYHQYMGPILFALNYLFWGDLSVIDARTALGGTGPLAGFPAAYGKMIVSRNPLAADVAAARVIGEAAGKTPALRHAMRRLGMAEKDLEVVGDAFEAKRLDFVPERVFRATRFGLWWRRPAAWLENLALVGMLAGVALRMGKASDFAGGGVQSLGTSLRVAWRLLSSIDLSEKVYE